MNSLSKIVDLINKGNIVEIRGNGLKYYYEYVKLLRKLSSTGRIHVVILNSSKYIDIHRLYNEIEPFLKQIDKLTIFWENDIEALIYHTILLEETKNSYLIIILPYISQYVSQVENTYLFRLRKVLKNEVLSRGWRIVVLNPVKHNSLRSIFNNILADIVVFIKGARKRVEEDKVVKQLAYLEH